MITQARISARIRIRKRFEDGFLKLWSLKPYASIYEPTIFLGMYDSIDFNIIKRHKGFKVLLHTGSRDYEQNNEYIKRLSAGTWFIDSFYCHFPKGVKVKELHLPIKDYSRFKPNMLGDKIFIYLCNEKLKERYGYELAEKVRRAVRYEVVSAYYNNGVDYKGKYYDNCFVNLNLSPSGCGGFTTAYELGYMGRMSITTSEAPYPMFIRFNDFDDLIDKINIESKKIGTIQPSLMDGFHTKDDSWKKEEFWR